MLHVACSQLVDQSEYGPAMADEATTCCLPELLTHRVKWVFEGVSSISSIKNPVAGCFVARTGFSFHDNFSLVVTVVTDDLEAVAIIWTRNVRGDLSSTPGPHCCSGRDTDSLCSILARAIHTAHFTVRPEVLKKELLYYHAPSKCSCS